MKVRNRKALLSMLMGTGLYLLDPLRNRLNDRLGRATRVIRGNDRRGINTTTAALIGVGVGVGLGLLFAPATGEETRSNIAGKVHDFGDKIRDRANTAATGTNY